MEITNLEIARRRKKLSVNSLSRIISCGAPTISSIEHRRIYAWPKLRKGISEALQLNENELFDESGFARVIKL